MTQPKAKRVIKDINFSGDESHIALVHKDQGGPANNAAYKLVLKAVNPVLEDKVDAAVQELTDGDKPKEDTSTVSVETKAENQNEVTSSAKTKKEQKMTKAVKDENKDNLEDNQAVEKLETVQKSVVVDLEKALNDQKVQLQKALDQVKQYEDIQKASVVKNKTDVIVALVKDETKTEALVKAGLALESQVDFDAYVQVIKSLVEQLDSSEMFVEKGVSGTAKEEKAPESSLTALIKSKFNK